MKCEMTGYLNTSRANYEDHRMTPSWSETSGVRSTYNRTGFRLFESRKGEILVSKVLKKGEAQRAIHMDLEPEMDGKPYLVN